MEVDIFCHLKDGDPLIGEVETVALDEPYTVLTLGRLKVFPTARQLAALGRVVENTRNSLRKELISAWANAHPEQPTPVERFGCCALCHQQTDQLFSVRVPFDYSYDTLEACAACARVEHADELAEALRLTEDETPQSVRADLHDDGMDDVPFDHKLDVQSGTIGQATSL